MKRSGWRVYFTKNSKGSPPGYPDLTAVHPRKKRVVFIELKLDCRCPAGSKQRTCGRHRTPDQHIWAKALRAAGAEYTVGKPSNVQALFHWLETGSRTLEYKS